ncbi:hypothetical protein JOC37_000259 [Desulfohalotomaculum tongense]|uniref:hypothetical protein n=1 Tax=Desulforadius tongensis TaxID=1216062 RepID=UPI001956E46E|nr:hypothetical protein [Desulforadius tongensis]MBM7853894.1 hypothetical protein [Desulforadius tongensis]
MIRKTLLAFLLTLLLCFSVAFASGAGQPTAKDLVLAKIKNFSLPVDKDFYDKSVGKTNFTISKFEGSLAEELEAEGLVLNGLSMDLSTQLDESKNILQLDYDIDAANKNYAGGVFITNDKIIFNKGVIKLLQDLGEDDPEIEELLQGNPRYLYLVDSEISKLWKQIATYKNQQLPEGYKEMLLFMVEAIPDKYFKLSGSRVVIELDQQGMEDFIYSFLTKVRNEKERFADIIISINQYQMHAGQDAEEMRAAIIAGIEENPIPTREEIHEISKFLKMEQLKYEASLIPGGTKSFNMKISFTSPFGDTGYFTVNYDAVGSENNLKGHYQAAFKYNGAENVIVDAHVKGNFNYHGPAADDYFTVTASAEDTATGELMLDLEAKSTSTSKVKKYLHLKAPNLTDSNSVDITPLLEADDEEVEVVEVEDLEVEFEKEFDEEFGEEFEEDLN